jgi:hypothetical protein
MARDFFSIASRTSRSASSRIACFDIYARLPSKITALL